MKHLRLVAIVLAALAWTAATAVACDMNKGASASGSAKGSCADHATATAASAKGSCSDHAAAAAAGCPAASGCPMGGKAARVNASAAAMGGSCCGAKGASASKGCDMSGANAACAVCLDEATCANDLRMTGVRSQVVALRNGAMIVYTAENGESVRALQATVARYNEHIMNSYASSNGASLCGECKAFRGAMASGKFTRELVNVKNGCQILLTSSDRTIVHKIHDMTGAQVAARIRS